LRCCPEINKIYILVRPKRNVLPLDRVKNEILSSHCFSVIKKKNPNFMKFIESKIIAIQGDLIRDGLGLEEADR
jgi:hypothetical protein